MAEIPIHFEKTVEINAPPEKVYALLSDYPRSAKHVPGIKKFEKKAKDHYLWQFKPVGAAGVTISPEYETMFRSVKNKEVSWESIKGTGNMDVKGKFTLKKKGSSTELKLSIDIIAQVPVPSLMKIVAKPFVEQQAHSTMDRYLKNIKDSFEK